MDNLNRVIAKIVADSRERPENERAAYLSGRRKDIEDETKRLSEDKIQLLDIYLVINTFNHASWPIQRKLLPELFTEDLRTLLQTAYPKLLPLIEYEWARRGEAAERPVYAKQLAELCRTG